LSAYLTLRGFWKYGINQNSEIRDFYGEKKEKIGPFFVGTIVKFHKNTKKKY